MRKITIYLFALMFASVTFMACDDQFAGQFFADPTVNEQGAQQVGEGFTMALASDFATPVVLSEEDMEENTLFQAIRMSQTPTLLGEDVEFRFRLEASDTEDFENVLELPSINENSIALVSAEDLAEAVVELFGPAPNARTMYVRVSAVLIDGSVTVRIPGQAIFPVIVTPLAPIIEEAYFLIGDFNGWNPDTAVRFEHSGRDVYEDPIFTILVENMVGFFRIIPLSGQQAGSDWWRSEMGNPIRSGNTDLTGTIVDGGYAMRIETASRVRITLNMLERTYTIELDAAPLIPETMFMIGQDFGNWNWASDGIVALTPVHSRPGEFWTIRYIQADVPFKFAPTRAWAGDFYGLGENLGLGTYFNVSDGNCLVITSGIYMIHIDYVNDRMTIEPARVYLIGMTAADEWSAGAAASRFTAVGNTLVSPAFVNDAQLRMFAASSIQTSDWWTREFMVFDGQIVYRGTGGDQARISVNAGQQITLDFNAGTGVIQ